MYLIKNPSKLERVMAMAGKKNVLIDLSETYTIKSLSLNVDMLFESSKIKTLLKKLILMNCIEVKKIDNVTYFSLSQQGMTIYNELNNEYYDIIKGYAESLDKIKSLSLSKLNSILNEIFKGAK